MQNDRFNVDLYIRVSTDRQAKEGDSLEEQEKELKKFCEYRQFQIRHIYIEKGKSGKNTNRPEYKKLIKDVATGKVNAVVVKQLDRLSRSLLDFEQFILLLQKHNVEFISLKENFDTTFAMGKAMFRVALVFAQLEREQNSERVLDVMAFRAEQGLSNGGRTPFGYVTVNKERVPYPKEKQIVELIFEKFLETKSTTQTAKFLNDTGCLNRNNKLWDKRHIQWILQNNVYIGKMRWKGEVFQGTHQPIISEKRFQMVQAIFREDRQIRSESKTKGILQKLIFCGFCGSPMTPSHSLNRFKIKYYYYRCTSTNNSEKGKIKCRLKYVPFKIAEESVFRLLMSLSEEQPFSLIESRALKHNQAIEKNLTKIVEQMRALEAKLETVKEKKDRYFDSLLSGQFTSAEREKINKRIEEMELEEKQLQAIIYKLQFDKNQQSDELINLTSLKQIFISFKADYEIYSRNELRTHLIGIIEKVLYSSDKLIVKFRALPFEMSFVL